MGAMGAPCALTMRKIILKKLSTGSYNIGTIGGWRSCYGPHDANNFTDTLGKFKDMRDNVKISMDTNGVSTKRDCLSSMKKTKQVAISAFNKDSLGLIAKFRANNYAKG